MMTNSCENSFCDINQEHGITDVHESTSSDQLYPGVSKTIEESETFQLFGYDLMNKRVQIWAIILVMVAHLMMTGASMFVVRYMTTASTAKQVRTAARFCRMLYTVVVVVIGSHVMFTDNPASRDVVYGKTVGCLVSNLVSVGFTIVDCALILASYNARIDYASILHHALTFILFATTLKYDSNYFTTTAGLLLEFGVLLVSPCNIIADFRPEWAHSLPCRLLNFLAIHTMHCRSIIDVYLLWLLFANMDRFFECVPVVVFAARLVSLLVFDIFTPYWIVLFTKYRVVPSVTKENMRSRS